AEDAEGNLVPTFNGSVALALGNNPGGSALGGKTTVTAVKGIATFTNLTLTGADTGYTLTASATGLGAATTSSFNVIAGAATHLVVMTEPPAAIGGAAIAQASEF